MSPKSSFQESMCLRRVEVQSGAVFKPVTLRDLRRGDIFRMFEPGDPGELVRWIGGHTLSICQSDPYLNREGVWEVECEPHG